MNIIEAAEKAGWSELGADLWGATFDGAMTKDALERFAQIIRNQALEDAAQECDKRNQVGDAGAFLAGHAIRSMKKEQP